MQRDTLLSLAKELAKERLAAIKTVNSTNTQVATDLMADAYAFVTRCATVGAHIALSKKQQS